MTTTYLLLGTNIGDRKCHLAQALDLLSESSLMEELFPGARRHLRPEQLSAVYETAAWGKIEQDDYLNQVVSVSTDLPPRELLRLISEIEIRMGRVRKKIWEPRIIDLDILFYGSLVITEERLSIPHPHLHHRRFALTPLADIAPDFLHPVIGKTVRELLESCEDPLSVRKYTGGEDHIVKP